MPRLRDVPVAAKRLGAWCLLKRIYEQMYEDRLPVWASALAYSWLFALFPFFIFLMTLVPYLPVDRTSVMDQVGSITYRALPDDAAKTLTDNIQRMVENPQTGLLSIGLILAMWWASGGIADTMSALNRCYEVEKDLPFYKARPIAIGLTIVMAVLLLLALVLLPLGTLMTEWLTHRHGIEWLERRGIRLTPAVIWTWELLRWTIGIMVLFTVVAIFYHAAPRIRHKFRFFTPGGIFTVTCWIILGFVFRYYVNQWGNYSAVYGTIGGVIVLLFIFYLDALVLLLGAEINAEIDYIMTATSIIPARTEEPSDLEPQSVQEANEGQTAQPAI